LPWLYNISDSQLITNDGTTSYWTCSFLTASDDHQYVVLGHTMWMGGIAQARASILDVTDPSYYKTLLYTNEDATVSSYNGHIDASIGTLGIRALSADNVTRIHSYSTFEIEYSLILTASPVLFNGGLGEFTFGNKTCGEWSFPAGRTEGTFVARGKELTVDPERSFTWYDRQWGGSAFLGNYTWFQLHVPGTDIKASIWAIDDNTNQKNIRIATFRFEDGSHRVLPFEFSESTESQYHSKATVNTYATKWDLEFPGQGRISVTSLRDDQETYNTSSNATPAYEGFSEFDFNLFGVRSQGYGLTEVVFFG
ncbi:kievitone hydratase, partial [Ilyonectria robusta]|uniref:kievitone hydratase n=1 Tax=Ilyonectria robusta TaxID=1079257 RepID=UPI001E8D6923